MKLKPSLSIIQGLLFTYCIENTRDAEREELISSMNVNNHEELTRLFDELTKPEFIKYKQEEREWYIDTLQHFLNTDENFDSVFYLFDTYFEDDIVDNRAFMSTLLECLMRYQTETAMTDPPT
ncbi:MULTISPECIES: hypothetical protein [Pseudomonas fluorescens group]|uniref:Uncharacterized protein n=1 Tax=Pseudomonas fluorescens TaxID=294 RepID=A0AAE2PX11_PSEFL|nr:MULTISPECIES: hypothetical protein [Pseudomonas fluorescens group]MBA1431498.1 hypothetical protein [Pseudomonas orientalis]MBD8269501.1 hypothetical protein [Pseudomonas fluorescens]